MPFEKILVANTGWSDDYQGSEAVGNFSYLKRGSGHEKFNFLPEKGVFYGYIPPLGNSPPLPADNKGWLIFFVSKRPRSSGLYLVGWYENATTVQGFNERTFQNEDFIYTVSTKTATAIPLVLRTLKIRGDHVKRPFAYLRGNGVADEWREELAEELLGYREKMIECLANNAVGLATENVAVPPNVSPVLDIERRKKIEKNAIEAVKKHFKNWKCESREHTTDGYDLLFTKSAETMHVEVKGTSMDTPSFFISANEFNHATEIAPNDAFNRRHAKDRKQKAIWRLAVVHNALSTRPIVSIYTYTQMQKVFELTELVWRGVLRS
jgi:hypothetical protein